MDSRKFAVVSRIPTPDSTYYPIPYYASLFKGKWYNIKQLIGLAKESKLRNSAPIKYQIEISQKYWELLLSDKTFLSRAEKIRAGTYCRSQPFLVTLLLPQTKITMGKSNHFSGQT